MYEFETHASPMRMEEEEEVEFEGPRMGYGAAVERPEPESGKERKAPFKPDPEVLRHLFEERRKIVDSKLSTRHKLKLLDANKEAIAIAHGANVTTRQRENIVYGILVFGGSVTVILALMTVELDLPAEIALTFVGTVLGGTIATISQKLGKL